MPRLQHVDFRKDPKEARRRLLALLGVTPVHGPAPLLPDLKQGLQEKSAGPQRWWRRWWAVGIGLRGQLQLLHDDLEKQEAVVRPHLRYFSLMAVHDNPYVSDTDLNLHLDALRIVLKRLSHNKPEVPVQQVDVSGCLLRIDLRDLAWDAGDEWSLDARWPPEKPELRNALDQPMPRSHWAGEDGRALFADYVRSLRLGVPRATQPPR